MLFLIFIVHLERFAVKWLLSCTLNMFILFLSSISCISYSVILYILKMIHYENVTYTNIIVLTFFQHWHNTFNETSVNFNLLPCHNLRSFYPPLFFFSYVVDAADPDNLPISKRELHDLLSKPSLSGIPLLVLGNKIDKPGALSKQALTDQM